MNIKTAIDNINNATDNAREKILSAYDHLATKGAIIPTDKSLANLPATIDSLSKIQGNDILVNLRGKIWMNDDEFVQLGFPNLDTSDVTDMSNLFEAYYKLREMDLSKWDLSNVKTTKDMFHGSVFTKIGILNGLKASIDFDNLATSGTTLTEIAKRLSMLGNVGEEKQMVNLSYREYNYLRTNSPSTISDLKAKGWIVGVDGWSDELDADDVAGSIIGKRANGDIAFVKYHDFINYTKNDLADFTPISIVVIPKSHTTDGHCRGISPAWMAYDTPEIGSINNTNPRSQHLCPEGAEIGILNYYPKLTKGNVTEGGTLEVCDGGLFPTDGCHESSWASFSSLGRYGQESFIDEYKGVVFSRYFSRKEKESTSGYNTWYKLPSPYKGLNEINLQCRYGIPSIYLQANTDMDGEGNTAKMIEKLSQVHPEVLEESYGAIPNEAEYYPTFACCYRYRGGGLSGWYLPSCGELVYFASRYLTILRTSNAINSTAGKIFMTNDSRELASSTFVKNKYVWRAVSSVVASMQSRILATGLSGVESRAFRKF